MRIEIQKLTRLGLVLLLLICTACQREEVASDLNQSQANRIVAVLSSAGIGANARKETGGRGKYTVTVGSESYSQAVSLLDSKGLPAEAQMSFAETVANQGLLPGSREMEQLRIDHALAVELEGLLENHPGIVTAKVIVRMNFLKEGEKPAVSVIIEEATGQSVSPDDIREIVLRSVPGVQKDDIYISSHPQDVGTVFTDQIGVTNDGGKVVPLPLKSFLGLWRIARDDYSGLVFSLLGVIALCAVAGAVGGYWYSYYQQSKRFFDSGSSELVPRVTRVDPKRVYGEQVGPFDVKDLDWTQKS